jgi:GDPmannose 4,6-dehydratase
MSSTIEDVPTAPLLKLNLPSPAEYRKRKVALISGAASGRVRRAGRSQTTAGITGQDGSYLYVVLVVHRARS